MIAALVALGCALGGGVATTLLALGARGRAGTSPALTIAVGAASVLLLLRAVLPAVAALAPAQRWAGPAGGAALTVALWTCLPAVAAAHPGGTTWGSRARRAPRPGPWATRLLARGPALLLPVLAQACVMATVVGVSRPWWGRAGPPLSSWGASVLVTAQWEVVIAVVALLWWRTEATDGAARRATLWLVVGAGFPGLVVGQVLFLDNGDELIGDSWIGGGTVIACFWAALAAVVVGARWPYAIDVRQMISQTARYLVSVEVTIAGYAGVMALADLAGAGPLGRASTTVLVVVLAATFHPLSRAVDTLARQLVFGEPADPVAVLASLGTHLSAGAGPPEWVSALQVELGVAGIQLWSGGRIVAQAGEVLPGPSDPGGGGSRPTSRVSLVVGEEEVGALVVAIPADAAAPDEHTVSVLRLVAPPLAQAMRGTRLAQELAAQRSAAVAALEEERRRLRRDLHDGLGPVLTGIAYGVDAARNRLATDPEHTRRILDDVRQDASSIIDEVRRLVGGLRPPSLDDRGLVEAVRARVARVLALDGCRLPVSVTATGPLEGLPAGVEVAVFRIAVEAVTNVARHAGAAREVCVQILVTADQVRLTVADSTDDASVPAASSPWVAGIGLTSMRERCEQLHGIFSAGPTPTGGLVQATFPLALGGG